MPPIDLVYLFVQDMDRAVGFYETTLGLRLHVRAEFIAAERTALGRPIVDGRDQFSPGNDAAGRFRQIAQRLLERR